MFVTARRLCIIALAACGLCAALSACGGGEGAAQSREASVLAFLLEPERFAIQHEVDAAEEVLEQRCLQAKGFEFYPSQPPTTAAAGSPLLMGGGPLGKVPPEAASLASARSVAFGIYASEAARQATGLPITQEITTQQGRYEASLSKAKAEAYGRALSGPSTATQEIVLPGIARHGFMTGGCQGEAERRLYGSPKLANEAADIPQDLEFTASHSVTSSAAMIAATKRWAQCFRAATSLSAPSPVDVVQTVLVPYMRKGATRALLAFEHRIAVPDAECQYKSGYLTTQAALFRKFASQLSKPDEALLLTLVEADATARHRAGQILTAAAR